MNEKIVQIGMSTHNWSRFMQMSAEKYRRVLATGDVSGLEDHNVMRGIDQEIDFVREIGRVRFGRAPAGRALDVCCGAGFFSAGLQRAGYDVTGIDLDENAIRIGQRLFPAVRFLHGDAVKPPLAALHGSFDLIMFREAHPFSRIGESELHEGLVRDYAQLLSTDGVIVIAHARRGGGMHYPSVDFRKLAVFAKGLGFDSAGPYFHVLYKRLNLRRGSGASFRTLSWGASALQRIVGARFIEFFVLSRSDGNRAARFAA